MYALLRIRGKGSAFFIVLAVALASEVRARIMPVPRDYAVELTATLSSAPPEIRLHWRGDGNATAYIISRKLPHEKSWKQIGQVGSSDRSYLDKDVQNGVAYEYRVIKENWLGFTGYGYIQTGIMVPLAEDRGAVLLVVEESIADPLEFELKMLEQDLLGDGWEVIVRRVPATWSPVEVKQVIRGVYDQNGGRLNTLFLLGHVPVPYSGNIMPDMHEQHRGAWPADVYYADLDGSWTDSTVNSTTAEQARNRNVPGDGKFDQDRPPSTLELQVGRVDLSRLTCFLNKTPSRTEVDLVRIYLDKNHRFRHARIPGPRRALLFDRRGLGEPEPMAASAWRTFPPFVGENIEQVKDYEFISRASTEHFLWSAVFSGGGSTWADQVGTSDIFALDPVNVVFTFFIGSFYGDWDTESNFLRASLGGAGSVLAAMYAGQPQWICHSMALGETIGSAARKTQENNPGGLYPPHDFAAGLVHVSLMGDPALRAHPVAPPVGLKGTVNGTSLTLEWGASPAQNLRGYLVYKRSNPSGRFERLTPDLINTLSFVDAAHAPEAEYLVKAVAITESPSGSYWNSSQGIFFPDPLGSLISRNPPSAPMSLVVTAAASDGIKLRWVASSLNHSGYKLERRQGSGAYSEIASIPGDVIEFTDAELPGAGTFTYRLATYNSAGVSAFSNEATGSTIPASADFVRLDWETQGNWIGVYGGEGYYVLGATPNLPPGISVTVSNAHPSTYTANQADARHLLDPLGQSRLFTLWSGFTPFIIDLNITDEKTHQISIYTFDPAEGRTFQLEVVDFVTSQVLETQKVGDHRSGVYFVYNVRGRVLLRITPESIYKNAVVYGIFFDEPVTGAVQLTKGQAGAFFGKQEIALGTATPGAVIHYTLDGSEPTTSSPRYEAPFWIYENTVLRARAFREGYPPSPIFHAEFINVSSSQGGTLRWDEETKGDWIGSYGSEGHVIANGGRELADDASVSINGASEWVWNESTSDARALFADGSGSARRASTWYAQESFTVDLEIQDASSRAVALYFVDWDRQGREQRIELIGPDGEIIEELTVSNFGDGQYLVFNVQGEIRIRATRLAGNNAVLSGIFFDPAPPGLSEPDPVRLLQPVFNGTSFTVKFAAEAGRKVCLDRSEDLATWNCLATNITYGEIFEMHDQNASGRAHGYYRIHFVP